MCIASDQLVGCDSGACCAAICDLTIPEQCDGGTCSPWFEKGQSPGVEQVGVCTGG